MIAKAREGGPNYIYSLMTGYRNPPAGLTVGAGQHYNASMPGDLTSAWKGDHHKVPRGGVVAIPPPLADGKVTFDDGTPVDGGPAGQGRRGVPLLGRRAQDDGAQAVRPGRP